MPILVDAISAIESPQELFKFVSLCSVVYTVHWQGGIQHHHAVSEACQTGAFQTTNPEETRPDDAGIIFYFNGNVYIFGDSTGYFIPEHNPKRNYTHQIVSRELQGHPKVKDTVLASQNSLPPQVLIAYLRVKPR